MARVDPAPKGMIKSPEAIDCLRKAGRMLARTLEVTSQAVVPGISGDELDTLARRTIIDQGGEPGFLGFEGFPGTICLSVNERVVHGIPQGQTIRAGDVVSLDIGVRYKGWNTDAALTVIVPPVASADEEIVKATSDSLAAGIRMVKPGMQLGDVQAEIQKVIEDRGYGLVRSLSGHGIGRSLHEAPSIPNYGHAGTGIMLEPGMVFCLEPMLTIGSGKVHTHNDGWGVITHEGGRSAHKEHTVLVTKDGVEVLTAQPGETF